MNHLQVWQQETTSLHSCDAWLKWVATVQELVGLDDNAIDGDRSEGNAHPDPVCIDELNDWHRAGYSAVQAAEIILDRIYAANIPE
ncbi:MAG: hypothetical protein V3U60_11145 [Gammaproteobacteria bacterium]